MIQRAQEMISHPCCKPSHKAVLRDSILEYKAQKLASQEKFEMRRSTCELSIPLGSRRFVRESSVISEPSNSFKDTIESFQNVGPNYPITNQTSFHTQNSLTLGFPSPLP
ncbi:hypothetical protein O181_046283 [Austropuccinia psidii MF-1]|uniref:Uncharacterized protein n=1 Tax=Austropuccinia psidii MF-1 TaxID=1389203 RepID=A0A9Q3DRZ2_9BASI|nr:hypothetical protein [Austropuccinia psidii MF-1]